MKKLLLAVVVIMLSTQTAIAEGWLIDKPNGSKPVVDNPPRRAAVVKKKENSNWLWDSYYRSELDLPRPGRKLLQLSH